MDRDAVEAALRKLPAECSAAFAVRVGLRVLPWLAAAKDGRPLARLPEKERAVPLLKVLLAYDVGVMVAWGLNGRRLHEVTLARRFIAYNDYDDDAAVAATDVDAAAIAAAATTKVFHDAVAPICLLYPDVGSEVAAIAATAAFVAGTATADAFGIINDFKLSVYNDIEILRMNEGKILIKSPLWLNPPTFGLSNYCNFKPLWVACLPALISGSIGTMPAAVVLRWMLNNYGNAFSYLKR